MAVMRLTPRGIDGGAVLPHPAIAASDSAPPRPGAGHAHGNNSSNGTAHNPSTASNHSSALDAIAALVGIVFVVLILGGIWLFSRFRRMPQEATPPPVEKKQHDKSATIAMLDALSAPVSKKEWQSALNDEKEDALVNVTAQDSCAICLDPISDADTIRPLPCRHVFHQPCFDRWFWKTHHNHHHQPTKCPLCRTDFLVVDAPSLPENSYLAP